MRIISEGRRDIIKLLFTQMDDNSIFRISRYILRHEVDDYILLHNTLTGELILVDYNEDYLLRNCHSVINPELKWFAEHSFLVPDDTNESQTVSQLRAIQLKRLENDGKIDRYSILPTTGCNARCFYCFESQIPRISMTMETATKVTDFITDHYNGRLAILSWFGGEPTLGKDLISYICQNLKDRTINIESLMISNGYLFDAKLVAIAKDIWNLKTIQITMDGTEKKYIETKKYVGIQDNPYHRVLRNIGLLANAGIRVNVRLNCDSHNTEDLLSLIDVLAENIESNKKVYVYVVQLDEDVGFTPIHHTDSERTALKQQIHKLEMKLEEMGWCPAAF